MTHGVFAYGVEPYGTEPVFVAPMLATPGQPFILLSPRESDQATFMASSELAGLPVANLQTRQPGKKYRSGAVSAVTIDIDFGHPVAANALGVVAHNLPDAGVVRARGGRTLARSTLDTGADVDTDYAGVWPLGYRPRVADWPAWTSLLTWDNDESFQYWRVDLADAAGGLTIDYIEAGRLMLGRSFQPSINFDIGGTPLGFDPTDVQAKTPYGRLFTDRRTASPARTFELACYAITKREAFDGIYEIQRLCGMAGDVICCLDPGESIEFHRFILQGVFTDRGTYTLPPAFDEDGSMFGAGIRLRELI